MTPSGVCSKDVSEAAQGIRHHYSQGMKRDLLAEESIRGLKRLYAKPGSKVQVTATVL